MKLMAHNRLEYHEYSALAMLLTSVGSQLFCETSISDEILVVVTGALKRQNQKLKWSRWLFFCFTSPGRIACVPAGEGENWGQKNREKDLHLNFHIKVMALLKETGGTLLEIYELSQCFSDVIVALAWLLHQRSPRRIERTGLATNWEGRDAAQHAMHSAATMIIEFVAKVGYSTCQPDADLGLPEFYLYVMLPCMQCTQLSMSGQLW